MFCGNLFAEKWKSARGASFLRKTWGLHFRRIINTDEAGLWLSLWTTVVKCQDHVCFMSEWNTYWKFTLSTWNLVSKIPEVNTRQRSRSCKTWKLRRLRFNKAAIGGDLQTITCARWGEDWPGPLVCSRSVLRSQFCPGNCKERNTTDLDFVLRSFHFREHESWEQCHVNTCEEYNRRLVSINTDF